VVPSTRGLSREAKRVPIFDGLRGVCAVMLLVVHIAWTARLVGSYQDPPSNYPAAVFIAGFQLAVGVFFLISGLFLFRPFARSIITDSPWPELGPYFLRRALRLLPAYYLVVAVSLLMLNFHAINGLWYVLRPILLMQNYDPVWMAGMDVTWTVPTEVQWYLALPLIAWAVSKYARKGADPVARARRMMIITPIFFVVGIIWFIYIHSPGMGIFPPQYFWPVGVAGNFGFGIWLGIMSALAQVSPKDNPGVFRVAARHPLLFWAAGVIVFAINCFHPWGRAGYGDYDSLPASLAFYALFILFCTLIVLPMIAPNMKSQFIDDILGNRVIVYLGRISYGIYLWHFVVLNFYFRSGNIFGGDPMIVPAMRGKAGFFPLETGVLLGTILIASLSYYLVERPLLEYANRKLNERQARRVAAADAVVPLNQPVPESANA
jgi:peptidoglycan/LPS O-acetylase OafA/YrhL